jgi:hypothetical protein
MTFLWTRMETMTTTKNCQDCYSARDLCFSCTGMNKFQGASDTLQEAAEVPKMSDLVNHPGHYTSLPVEAIRIIELALTEAFGPEGYQAYCFGNELKYRLRAGFKGPGDQDLAKALKYRDFRRESEGKSEDS